MKDAIKLMLIPIVGCIAIGLIFIFVVWSGNFQKDIENEDGKYSSASRDIGGYAIFHPTPKCDDSYFPVCGFDGVTYNNACKALANSTKVAHRGVCES
jgi:hypothetical protein